MRNIARLLGAAASAALAAAPAAAAETITYKYDARGRLTEVARDAGARGAATTAYALDKADNRLSKTITGALAAASPASSSEGYRIIPTGSFAPGSPPTSLIVIPAGE